MAIREQNSSLTSDPTSLYTPTLDSVTASALSAVVAGEDVSLDETAGLQNATATPSPAGDADDNDILVASLPSAFSTRLTALGAGTATGAALSGYTGTVGDTGSNAFTLTDPSGITDIRFVDSAGAPLDGVDSGLFTLDGTSILLYTDTNDNNILVGRAGAADGAIVFAAYIEETGSPVTGGKIWTVEYQPLKHPDITNPDDSLNLLNKVFVGVSQDLGFSLAGAPSGQNLFLMFTKLNPATETVDGIVRITDPTIIATGKDPADQSSGAKINTGDTINTSQGGGPTTIGTNNQMITEQEGIRFSFVTGARQNVTVPNLSQTEADVESNIDFTGVHNSTSASFDVVQLQGGKSAVVKVSAFNTAAEPGVNFINGYAGDASVAITNIRVINISTGLVIENSDGSVNDPAIGITFDANGVATITGVLAGYQIEYTTTSDHNRVLIENGAALDARGNDHADFDIGGFTLRKADTAIAEIGSKMIFEDDGPSISTTGDEPALTVDETVLATDDTQSFTANFTSAFGADGAGTQTYALGVVAGASGLTDTATGEAVNLSLNGTVVEGRTATTGLLVFTVSVAANGDVTLDQQRAVVHPDPNNPDDATSLTSDDLVTLTATITDKDGDSAQATLNIGQNLVFEDDGPSISTTGTEPVLTVDETVLATDDTQSFTANFTSAFGADGAGTQTYALGVVAGASGLTDTATGEAVNLSLNGGVVQGRTATTGLLVFTVSVAANGDVTLDQQRAVVHPDPNNPDDATSLTSDDLVTLTATITDKDGDSAQATLNIGQNLVFKDDGPTLAFGNLIGTGSVLPQFGYWDSSAGADGLGAAGLDISVNNQFTLVRPDNTTTVGAATLTELALSPDANGAYQFAGTLTADFDNNVATADTTVDYTLTAFANGSYALDLVQGFSSEIVLSSADGSLDAGGPDPVRTLLIPETDDPTIPSASEEVVFFSAKPLASTADILTGIGLGAPDPTEATLQTNPLPSFIDPAAMNVSTAGIGVANNLFQGDNLAAISNADESFVINPESLLTAMKVFIDNSVGGYNTATEDLYYRAFYEDGTFSNLIEVNTLTPEAGGQVSFLIEQNGTKLIDAVQLTMARGEIKIPTIQFTHESESLASDVQLTFNATLTDKDGDSATSTFDANLFANDLDNALFDFTLVGTGGERDAFNVDLSVDENLYQATGFDANASLRDTLVLNGDQSAVVQSIDNTGADSIVTVAETGGQITTITLVGVDLLSSDIVIGGV